MSSASQDIQIFFVCASVIFVFCISDQKQSTD